MERSEHGKGRTRGRRARTRAGHRSRSARGRLFSRKEFVGLGLSSAALLGVGAFSPLTAGAQAATVGHLRDYCVGDGREETENIQRCIDENQTIVVDAVDTNGKALVYGIGPYVSNQGVTRIDGVRIPSDRVIRGTSATQPGRFVRAKAWTRQQLCFRNLDYDNGNRNITMQDIVIEGRRNTDPTVPVVDSDNDTICIRFKVSKADAQNRLYNVTMNNVEVRNWPGIGISVLNGKKFAYTNVRNINSARGGIRFTAASNNIRLNNCKSLDTGDTSFGFWAADIILSEPDSSALAGDLHDIILTNCQSNTRDNSQYGAACMLRGARLFTARGCTFGPSKNDVVQIYEEEYKGVTYVPKDILIEQSRLQGGKDNSFQVIADHAERVKAQYNTMFEPADNCVSLVPKTHNVRHTLGVAILNNTLVRPGGKHIRIDDDIRGVTISGNKLVYDDAKAPTITNVEPPQGSTVTRRNVYVKAVVKDNAGGSGMVKSGIKVFVDGNSSAFDYFPNSGNLVCPKSLSNGKHNVKITAKDLAGNATSKTWSFTVRA